MHPQAAAGCMVNKANQGLEEVFCHNDSMMRTQERENKIFNTKKKHGEKTN